jgi:predicted hotdog family 3-hydroxylacyl-ACP dehydratase
MCLLDGVESWDDKQIVCTSTTHQNQDNPLAENNRLACINAVEYGAQAVAIHGNLIAKNLNMPLPESGFLVQIKALEFDDCNLSSLPEALIISAQQIYIDPGSLLYSITIQHGQDQLMQGRIMIFTQS